MATVQELWKGAIPQTGAERLPDPETRQWLQNRALHALKFFTFHSATPSPLVSSEMEKFFFACGGKQALSLMSSVGVRSAADVRIPNPEFASFLKNLPMVPQEFLTEANIMMQALERQGMVKHIAYPDILAELRQRPLSTEEATACLRWWTSESKKYGTMDNLERLRSMLLDAIVVTTGVPGTENEKIITLSSVTTFVNTKRIPGALFPLDGPLPSSVMPIGLSNNFSADELTSAFPWSELTLIEWLRHLTSPAVTHVDAAHDLNLSVEWSERVLNVISKAWSSISKEHQAKIVEILGSRTCIPTTTGLKKPSEAYFANVKLFSDLPIVSGNLKGGATDRLLQALGVRKHVDLQIVFNRFVLLSH
jgi:hypothetical protein